MNNPADQSLLMTANDELRAILNRRLSEAKSRRLEHEGKVRTAQMHLRQAAASEQSARTRVDEEQATINTILQELHKLDIQDNMPGV